MPSPTRLTDPASVRMVRVWDLPTRAFHWLLVLAVAVALGTGFIAPEWWMGLHLAAGYLIILLLVFRIAWGFFGPEYSRLVSLLRVSRGLGDHLRGLLLLRPPHYAGHNPAGALMIGALFAVLTALVVTGLMVQGGEEKQGPLAGILTYRIGDAAKGWHEILVYLLVAMIAMHVAGVLVEGRLLRMPFIRGMIGGWLPLPRDIPVPAPKPARPVAAAAMLGVFALVAASALAWLERLPPAGIPAMSPNETASAECGACHWAYHPSLLPRASWAALLADLENHFGEDASLPAAETGEIASFYDRYAAEAWDTEAARRFAAVAASEPKRITATPYWVAKHASIAPATFAAAPIGSRGNCIACHRDADSGRFDDQAIAIPGGIAP
jgi:cytochrome b